MDNWHMEIDKDGTIRFNKAHPKAADIKAYIHSQKQASSSNLSQGNLSTQKGGDKNGTNLALKRFADKLTAKVLFMLLKDMAPHTEGAAFSEEMYQDKLFEEYITRNAVTGPEFEAIRMAVYREIEADAMKHAK